VTPPPQPARQPTRQKGRRDEILAAFIRHVSERGYDGTNLADLAAELGLSKGTIVHHFGTKDRMLRESHESYMGRRIAEAERIIAGADGPADQLAALIYAFVLYQVEDRAATVAFQREVVRFAGDPAMAGVRALTDRHRALVAGVLDRGVAAGAFRPGDGALRQLVIFGAAQWAWTWFDPAGPRSAEEVGAAFVDLVLGGLLVDRSGLTRLADPGGPLPLLARACLSS
jgi:TetR/AcrR family transcriptional regulator, cholesterol catabolism regulator